MLVTLIDFYSLSPRISDMPNAETARLGNYSRTNAGVDARATAGLETGATFQRLYDHAVQVLGRMLFPQSLLDVLQGSLEGAGSFHFD